MAPEPTNEAPLRRSKRLSECDKQAPALLSGYPVYARLDKPEGLGLPFTDQDIQPKKRVTHILCGDWNSIPADHGLEKSGWLQIDHEEFTSAGKKAYDHFVCNKDAANRFSRRAEVHHFTAEAVKNLRAGQAGASDHHIILLDLKEKAPWARGKK